MEYLNWMSSNPGLTLIIVLVVGSVLTSIFKKNKKNKK